MLFLLLLLGNLFKLFLFFLVCLSYKLLLESCFVLFALFFQNLLIVLCFGRFRLMFRLKTTSDECVELVLFADLDGLELDHLKLISLGLTPKEADMALLWSIKVSSPLLLDRLLSRKPTQHAIMNTQRQFNHVTKPLHSLVRQVISDQENCRLLSFTKLG